MSSDAYHITLPPADGEGARKCMAAAIKDAGIDPTDIDYINTHGTSTPAGDIGETNAVKSALEAEGIDPERVLGLELVTVMMAGFVGRVNGLCALADKLGAVPEDKRKALAEHVNDKLLSNKR